MTRRRRWMAAGVVAVLAVGGWLVVRQAGPWLGGIARHRITAGVAELTGCRVDLPELDLAILSGRAEARNARVDCGPDGRLTVDRLAVDLALSPLLRRRVSVRRLEVVRPVLTWRGPAPAWLQGRDEEEAGGSWSFRLAEATVRDGRASWQDTEGAWSADLRDMALSSERLWDGRRLELQGRLGAGVGTPQGDIQDLRLTGDISWQEGRLTVANLEGTAADGGRVAGEVTLAAGGDGPPVLTFEGAADVPSERIRTLVPLPAWVAVGAPLHWEGTIRGEGTVWSARGDAATAELSVYGLPLRDLVGSGLSVSTAGELTGSLRSGALGGRAVVDLEPGGEGPWRLRGRGVLEDLDLSRWPEAWPWPEVLRRPAIRIDGHAGGRLPLLEPAGAGLQGELRLEPAAKGPGTWAPAGTVRARVEDGAVEVSGLEVTQDETRLGGRGGLAADGSLQGSARLDSSDLAATLGRILDLQALGVAPDLLPSGRGAVTGSLSGRPASPRADLTVAAQDLSWKMLPLGRLDADLVWSDGALSLRMADLAGPLADAGLLGSWSPGGEAGLTAGIARLDLELLAVALGLRDAAAGTMRGRADVTWTQGRVRGEVDLEGRDVSLARRSVDTALLTASLGDDGLTLTRLDLRREGGVIRADGHLPWTWPAGAGPGDGQEEGIRVEAESLPLQVLTGLPALTGRISVSGRAVTGLSSLHPVGSFDLGLSEGAVAGWMLPAVDGGLELDGAAARLDLSAADPPVTALLAVDWSGSPRGRLDLTVGAIEVPVPGGIEGLKLQLSGLQAEASGELADLPALEASVEVPEVALRTPAGVIRTADPIRVVASGGLARLEPVRVHFDSQELTVTGAAELAPADAPAPTWRLQAVGLTDLASLQFLVSHARIAGTALLETRMEGVGVDWQLLGELGVQGGYLRLTDFPNAFEEIEARAVLSGDRLTLESLEARLGGGWIEGSGEVRLERWRPTSYRVDLSGERVATRYPRGVRSLADFDLTLEGTSAEALLSGDVTLLQARYSEPFNIERRMLSRLPPPLPPPPGLLDRVLLDLSLDAPGGLWIDNDFARAEFLADLEIGGTAARPVPEGTVELVRTGRVTFREVDYQVVEAALTFSPAAPNNPDLSVLARTDLDLYRVELGVFGPLSQPRIELSSDPDLAQDEIVVLLLMGSLPDDSQQVRVSSATVAGYLGGALLPPNALKGIGIDEARIDPVFVEGQGDPTARLTLTERIGSRLSASWSTTLGGVQGDTVELRYRVRPHIELRTAQEETGAAVIEGRYVRTFPSKMQRRQKKEPGQGDELLPARRPESQLTLGPVSLSGVPTPPGPEALRPVFGLAEGERVARSDVLAAASAVRQALIQDGYMLARVGCEILDPGPDGRSPVRCAVDSGPYVRLRLEGLRRKKDRAAVEQAIQDEWMEVLSQDDMLESAATAAKAFYREKGHARATAVAEQVMDGEGPSNEVLVRIEPGPRVRVSEVVLEGLGELDPRDVRDHMVTTGRVVLRRALLTPEAVAQDRETLERLLAGYGYLDARVPTPAIEFVDRDEARLVFSAEPGERRLVAAIDLNGVSALDPDLVRSQLRLGPGDKPDPALLEDSALAVRLLYDNRGYPDAVVYWRLERAAAGARLVLDVQEGPHVRVGDIVIEGLGVTEEKVVRREIAIRPGQPFQREALLQAQRRVRDLGLFRSVVAEGRPASGQEGVRDVVIRVKERNAIDVAGGIGFDDQEGLRVSASAGNRNFLGKAATLSFQARLAQKLESGELRNGWRRVGGSRNDLLGVVALRSFERAGFTEERESLVGQISRPWNRETTIQARYRIEHISLSDVTTFEQDSAILQDVGADVLDVGWFGSVGGAFIRKTLDDPMNPRDGGLRTVDLSLYARSLGSDFQYSRLFFQQVNFWEFARGRLVYQGVYRGGFMWPYGETEAVPLPERFFAGGISSVRGYEQDRLGPTNPVTGEPVGGESTFVTNQELRIQLTDTLAARAFVDAGNVFLKAGDLDFGDLKWTAGPGFSVATPAGPLRLYYGFKLNRDPDDPETGRFHITFGIAF